MCSNCHKLAVLLLVVLCGCVRAPSVRDLTLGDVTEDTDVAGVRRYRRDEWLRMGNKYGPDVMFWDWVPAPAGFEITPDRANFIYSSLLRNAWHFGASASNNMYYDADSYYIAEIWPTDNQEESARPMLEHATRISGLDGRVFNRASNIWERAGYVHLTHAQMAGLVKAGDTKDRVTAAFGRPFEIHREPLMSPYTKASRHKHFEALEYWDRDGQMVFFLGDGLVTDIATGVIRRQ